MQLAVQRLPVCTACPHAFSALLLLLLLGSARHACNDAWGATCVVSHFPFLGLGRPLPACAAHTQGEPVCWTSQLLFPQRVLGAQGHVASQPCSTPPRVITLPCLACAFPLATCAPQADATMDRMRALLASYYDVEDDDEEKVEDSNDINSPSFDMVTVPAPCTRVWDWCRSCVPQRLGCKSILGGSGGGGEGHVRCERYQPLTKANPPPQFESCVSCVPAHCALPGAYQMYVCMFRRGTSRAP